MFQDRSLLAYNALPWKSDAEVSASHRSTSYCRFEKAGFEVLRIKGSHHFMSHADGRRTVVPVHRGEAIGPGLMLKIIRDCEMERQGFLELLK